MFYPLLKGGLTYCNCDKLESVNGLDEWRYMVVRASLILETWVSEEPGEQIRSEIYGKEFIFNDTSH